MKLIFCMIQLFDICQSVHKTRFLYFDVSSIALLLSIFFFIPLFHIVFLLIVLLYFHIKTF